MNMKNIRYVVTQKRENFLKTFTPTSTCRYVGIQDDDTTALMKSIEDQLGLEPDTAIHENITEESLRTASEMLAYLTFCPPKAEMDAAAKEAENLINIYTPKELMVIVSRMIHAKGNNLPYKREFITFVDKLRKAWNPRYEEILKLAGKKPCDAKCEDSKSFPEDKSLSEMINHPVHIYDENQAISESSLIPFCWFGKKKELGTETDMFNVSTCNNFKPKLRNDQVCYEMDPNQLLDKGQNANNIVLYFLIDQNKDRQYVGNSNSGSEEHADKGETFMEEDGSKTDSVVYLNTIGNNDYFSKIFT